MLGKFTCVTCDCSIHNRNYLGVLFCVFFFFFFFFFLLLVFVVVVVVLISLSLVIGRGVPKSSVTLNGEC